MRLSQHTQQAIVLLLSFWTTAITAISLSNFTPHIDNLPSACNAVYTQTIPGCEVSDFSTNAQCSKACINGLEQISAEVNSQCANADVAETSIIGVFLLGQGIPALCNIQVTTVPGTTQAKSTAPAPAPSSATPKSSAGIIVDTSSAPVVSSPLVTSAAASSTPPATSFAPDSSSAEAKSSIKASSTSVVLSLASSTKSAAATKTSTEQKSNPNSGGGSPFDVQAVGNSSPDSSAPRWLAGTTALLLSALLLIS